MKSDELNDLFDYGYSIYQNSDYFKFSIDSVLLAEFVSIRKGKKSVLDLCSGNAPIPMILYKKYGDSINITAVELQEEIYCLGKKSLEYNRISSIDYINDDVRRLSSIFKNKKFDIITCNPPYFKVNVNNYINDNQIKAVARHEIMLDLDSLLVNVAKVIQNKGYFYMVHHADRLVDVISVLKKYNFGVKTIVPIYNDNESDASIFLIESVFNGKDYVNIRKPVFLVNYASYKNIFER